MGLLDDELTVVLPAGCVRAAEAEGDYGVAPESDKLPGAPAPDLLFGGGADGPEDGEERLIGRTLGGFRIMRVLGAGSVGVVFLAEQVALERLVALKVLRCARAADPEYLKRFHREALVVARLIHPNAVQVHDVGRADGYYFMALEYIDGESLAERLERQSQLFWRTALDVASQAAASLEQAHGMGIVHRDIKPENLMIDRSGCVKVTDFGIARLADDPARTADGLILGTPLYMSPEQGQGDPAGPAADLYSLGATLYHMLVGYPPFVGLSTLAVMHRHLTERPRPPAEREPSVPAAVSDLTLRLLEKDPAARPASARALIEEIAAILSTVRPVRSPSTRWRRDPIRRSGGAAPARSAGDVDGIEEIRRAGLGRQGLREVLAHEAACACLVPRPRRSFLEATMRNYRIPLRRMLPLLEKETFTREDVWELQMLKRAAEGDRQALELIARLRRLEPVVSAAQLRARLGRAQPPVAG